MIAVSDVVYIWSCGACLLDFDLARVTTFIQSICNNSALLSDIGTSLTYTLPSDNLPKFDDLFTALSANLEDLGLVGYGVSDSTLYEVHCISYHT